MSADTHLPPPSVALLVTMCVLNHVALSGARLVLALQALRLGVPAVGLGLMLAPFALASALGALPLGRLVDRIGARGPALAGMAATTIALALAAWRPAPAMLAATAAAIGLGYTAALIALQSELARDRDERARAASFAGFAAGTAASGSLGPFLAGHWSALGGAPLAFGAMAAMSLAACGIGAWQARRLLSLREATPRARVPLLSRTTLCGLRPLRRILLADLLMAFAWNANGVAVPLVGQREGWSAATAGDLLGVFGAAVLLVRALPHSWRARGGDWGTITRALLVGGAALALLPLATALPLPYVLEALFGAGLGSSLPSVLALVERGSPPDRRAEVLGLRQVVLSVGAVATPAGLGALATLAGLAPAVGGVGAALLAAGAAIAPRLSPRR